MISQINCLILDNSASTAGERLDVKNGDGERFHNAIQGALLAYKLIGPIYPTEACTMVGFRLCCSLAAGYGLPRRTAGRMRALLRARGGTSGNGRSCLIVNQAPLFHRFARKASGIPPAKDILSLEQRRKTRMPLPWWNISKASRGFHGKEVATFSSFSLSPYWHSHHWYKGLYLGSYQYNFLLLP